jgi:uncharacterized protein with WD repeat
MSIQISINGQIRAFSNRLEAISYLASNKIDKICKQKNKRKDYSFENCAEAVKAVEDCIAGKIELPTIKDITKLRETLLGKAC